MGFHQARCSSWPKPHPPLLPTPQAPQTKACVPWPAGHSHRESFGEQSGFPQRWGGSSWGGLLTRGHPPLANSPQLRARPWGCCEPGQVFFKGASQGFLPYRGRSGHTLPGLRMAHSSCPTVQPALESRLLPGSALTPLPPQNVVPAEMYQ